MFYELKATSILLYMLIINIIFVNIFFFVYLYYKEDTHPLYRKLALFLFLPIWIFIYVQGYGAARSYLFG
jgi:hypothetical protein